MEYIYKNYFYTLKHTFIYNENGRGHLKYHRSLLSRGPEDIFPDMAWDPDRSCQRLELGVSVSGIPGGSPLDPTYPYLLASPNPVKIISDHISNLLGVDTLTLFRMLLHMLPKLYEELNELCVDLRSDGDLLGLV